MEYRVMSTKHNGHFSVLLTTLALNIFVRSPLYLTSSPIHYIIFFLFSHGHPFVYHNCYFFLFSSSTLWNSTMWINKVQVTMKTRMDQNATFYPDRNKSIEGINGFNDKNVIVNLGVSVEY